MDKYSVDFTNLDNKYNGTKSYKLADVQHLIVKVAFDVVRFRENEDTTQLWKIEDSVDGPVIVAMYDSVEETVLTAEASASEWEVIADGESGANVFYKGEAIKRIATTDVGLNDIHLLCRWLPNKLASDASLRSSLIKDMAEESKNFLLVKYPELRG